MDDPEIPPPIQSQLEEFPYVTSLTQPSFIERYGISPSVFAFLSLIIIFILYQIVGGVATFFLFGLTPNENNVEGYRLATAVGQVLFIFLPTLILVRFASSKPKEFFRVRMPDIRTLIIPIIGIFSLQQMLQIYLVFQERIPLPEPLQKASQQFKELFEQVYKLLATSHTVPELLWVIVVLALIPAIAEEFLFRGLVQRSLQGSMTPMRAALVTGIIFGAYHLNPFSFIPLVILGMYLGFLAMRADSIWASSAAHFYNNAAACVATYFRLDDDAIITGNPDQMSLATLLGTFWFFGVIFLLSTFYYIKITQPKEPTVIVE
jgi:membrane protease YdiL (CAAX protease family)